MTNSALKDVGSAGLARQALAPAPASGVVPVFEYNASASGFRYALQDLRDAVRQPRLILTLINTDFLNRFNGSVLGGLWVTLSTAMIAVGLATLYGQIFAADMATFLPYVTIGVIVWGLISSQIIDGSTIFIAGASDFNNARIPKATFAFQAVGRSVIYFAFKIVVIVGVFAYVGAAPSPKGVLLSIAGIAIVCWSGFWTTLALGTLCARFRDVGELTSTAMTAMFFFTPIFWRSDRLGDLSVLMQLNPFHHYINIVRGPLLGEPGVATSFVAAGGISLFATFAGGIAYGLFARRLPYWC